MSVTVNSFSRKEILRALLSNEGTTMKPFGKKAKPRPRGQTAMECREQARFKDFLRLLMEW